MTKSDKFSSIFFRSRGFFFLLIGMCSLLCVNCDNYMVQYLLPIPPELPKYTVTFITNVSGLLVPPQTVTQGRFAFRPTPPNRPGWTLTEWYTDNGTFKNKWDFAKTRVTKHTALFAHWSEITVDPVAVTFVTNVEGLHVPPHLVVPGRTATEPTPPLRKGYDLEGWYSDASLANKWNFAAMPVSAAMPLYAKWVFAMVPVPGGTFEMGRDLGGGVSESTTQTVTLTSFQMSRYEITQEQYRLVMGSGNMPAGLTYGGGNYWPIYFVSWYGALKFCNTLSMREGLAPVYRINNSTDPLAWGTVPNNNSAAWNAVTMVPGANGYRLPTEAQWEYAAKGGNGTPGNSYAGAGSDKADDVGWYIGNSGGRTAVVGNKKPNNLGLYDMSGNVCEWCWDWFVPYAGGTQSDPLGASSGLTRVYRGGGHGDGETFLRSVSRLGNPPQNTFFDIGIRVVRPAQ